ncbi:MAG: efflux transporter outer membrane subunit [Pirellulales bacterium]|nr:efflux transporter outer membrane subunit [Pirellulales bacterium]
MKNGFKVGPNYCPPPAPVKEHWIDEADVRVRSQSQIPCFWWTLFNDPVLNGLVANAYGQNLTLREAGMRVLEARYQRAITVGQLFPQQQNAAGSYQRWGAAGVFSNQWNFNFNLAWELDFWGRYRRAVIAADDALGASVANYDDVLVTLISDVAANYIELRTNQERIRLLTENINIQQKILMVGEEKRDAGHITAVDVEQLRSNVLQNQAQLEQYWINIRLVTNQLCILLGMPPVDIERQLGHGPIPYAPADLAVGIPADLLRRRPDVRRAERLAAAQAQQIGIAEADLYPAFTIDGSLGYAAQEFPQLFTPNSFNGNIGPSFRWNLLNYGRIANNVRLQDAQFQELVFSYQNIVLQAQAEVENGLVTFLRAQQQAKLLDQSAQASSKAVEVILIQLQTSISNINYNQYAVIQQNLIQQQDSWAAARGQIALGMVEVYRALGGGWEIRLEGVPNVAAAAPPPNPNQEPIPLPNAQPAPLPPLPPPPQQPQPGPKTP